jgi:hypothetical protein
MKQLLIILAWLIAGTFAYSQNTDYKEIYLSISGGTDYPIGKSNTEGIYPEMIMPFTKKGIGGSFEAAYFFTPNYSVGIKYHLYSGDYEDANKTQIIHDLNKTEKDVLFDKYTHHTFDEITHFVGPAVFGRWTIGETRWSAVANVSIGYVYNKLSKIKQEIYYHPIDRNTWSEDENSPRNERSRWEIPSGNTFGVTCSTGINYQIISAIGIQVSVNGMFASWSRSYTVENVDGQTTVDISRKLNRMGLAAGLNYSF